MLPLTPVASQLGENLIVVRFVADSATLQTLKAGLMLLPFWWTSYGGPEVHSSKSLNTKIY